MPITYTRPANFSERCHRIMELAGIFAAERQHADVTPIHITIGLVREGWGVAATALQVHGLKLGLIERELAGELPHAPSSTQADPLLTAESQALLFKACDESRELRHSYVGTEHLLLALLQERGATARILGRHGFTYAVARARVLNLLNGDSEDPTQFVSHAPA